MISSVVTPPPKSFKFSLATASPAGSVSSGSSGGTGLGSGGGGAPKWVNRSAPENWLDGKDPWMQAYLCDTGGEGGCQVSLPLEWYKSCSFLWILGGCIDVNTQGDLEWMGYTLKALSESATPWMEADRILGDYFVGTTFVDGYDAELAFRLVPLSIDVTSDVWTIEYNFDGTPERPAEIWSLESTGVALPNLFPPWYTLPWE